MEPASRRYGIGHAGQTGEASRVTSLQVGELFVEDAVGLERDGV